jgi:succinyl-CoA synthetase beta subunit
MFLEEAAGKALLAAGGIRVPRGVRATSPAEAEAAARGAEGPVVVKAQVAAGKRGKSGGIVFPSTAAEAAGAAGRLIGSSLGGLAVEAVLVEERVAIARELYAAVVTDGASRGPLLLFSTEGGVDIEETFASRPDAVVQRQLDVRRPLDPADGAALARRAGLGAADAERVGRFLAALYDLYRARDCELVEVNPLALTPDGSLVALDAKVVIDDAALARQPGLPEPAPTGTELERRGRQMGLLFVELDGDVGVLANGAGLTMATMDAVAHYGGRPANFLEIGGQNYKRATDALGLVLANPRVRSLLVNLCGAYARTDVIVEGFLAGWEALRPTLPVAFSIHGTGEARAVQLVKERLGVEPYDLMDDAVKAAIAAARAAAPAGGRR